MEDFQTSEREIAYGTFMARNRKRIRNIFRWGLLGIDVVLIGVLGYIVFGIIQTEMQVPTIANSVSQGLVAYSAADEAPSPLRILSTDVLKTSDLFVDVIAEVENPNTEWAAYEAEYSFSIGSREINGMTQILPGETKYVAVTNIDIGGGSVTSGDLTFGTVDWERIKQPEEIPSESWDVKTAAYETIEVEGEDDTTGRVVASVTNRSIFGYQAAEVLAVLEQNGDPVGVRIQRVEQWPSFETKDLRFSWPKAFPVNVKPVIQVDTNVLDENNIITEVQE